MRCFIGVAGVLALSALAACAPIRPDRYATYEITGHARPASTSAEPFVHRGLPLRSGQIVLSERANAGSVLLTLPAETFAPYVHAGIVSIEDGRAWIYDEFGSQRPHLRGPPTSAMGGRVRRVPFDAFLRGARIVAVHELPEGVDASAVVAFARRQHREGLRFDPWFDSSTSDRMYCTEFVARALEAGGAGVRESPLRNNPSYAVVREWLGMRAESIFLAGELPVGPRVARVSRDLSAARIDAWFELKRELHRRFTADQRLGNVFEWTWRGPRLRPEVRRFIDEGMQRVAAGEALSPADLAAQVRELGVELFGPVGEARAACADCRTP